MYYNELLRITAKNNPELLTSGQVKMKCPFRENHKVNLGRDSMFLSPDINRYHCFSCREKGKLSELLVKFFDIDIYAALDLVINIPSETPKKVKVNSFEVDEPWTVKPYSFFTERGFPEEFQISKSVGVTEKGRIVIPYYAGDVLKGVQYRKDVKKKGSYKKFVSNSDNFDKINYLYNYKHDAEEATLVEGYTDSWRLELFDEHAEAVLGGDISDEQAYLLSSHKNIYLATDNDETGRRLLEIANFKLSAYPVTVWVIPYLEKDPGLCLSRKKWRSYKNQAVTYAEYATLMAIHDDTYIDNRTKWLKNVKKIALFS